jgi:cytochrome P450
MNGHTVSTPAIAASTVDLYSDESISSPYTIYAELRALGPVVWLDKYDVWAVPRYAEVYEILHDHETFSSASGVGITEQLNEAQRGSLLTSDPPYHDKVRALVMRHLAPRALRQIEPDIDYWAETLVDELITRDSFDAVTDFGQAFPLAMVPDLMGWPIDEGKERFLAWASAGFNAFGPIDERAVAGFPLLQEMGEFLVRMSTPGNLRADSWGACLLQNARDAGIEGCSVPALLGDLLAPSLDTTVSALASALWLFGTHAEQWDAIRADQSLVHNTFNEIIRFESPLRALTRMVTLDHELGGHRLAAGSRVLLLYGSANRDERHWRDADFFDIRRVNANEHLGFGHGIHGCVGQALARLEAKALLAQLARKVSSIEVGTPKWRLHNTIRGIESMPVSLRV